MIDPSPLLHQRLSEALARVFGDEFKDADPLIRPSDRADYQVNVAMSLAKRLKRKPREVADELVAGLEVKDICDKIEIAGPGFINLTLAPAFIGERCRSQLSDPRAGVSESSAKETVVIDYSAPNVAKEMHVGHLRSTIIGDALARLLRFRGHTVIAQNHLGDWGTPFGMLIEHLLDLGQVSAEAGGQEQSFTIENLNTFYQEARKKFDGDTTFADRCRKRVVSLQAGDAQTLALWQRFVDESKRHIKKVYAALEVELTDADICGESFFNDMLPETISLLEEKGLAVVDDGAVCVFVPGFTARDGSPLPLIIRKQDGGYGYATTDLAAMRYRTGTLKATRLLYVVGAPQQQHLTMIYEACKLAGWLSPPARAEHVAFGSVLGDDGKMFKTRAGQTITLSSLIDEGFERAYAEVQKRFPELDQEAKNNVARQVGVGAFKYADLSSDRVKDYTFDLDRMVKFEGNSGGYLQYAHARCRSIVRNAGAEPEDGPIAIEEKAERTLALLLLRFNSVVTQVEESLSPHSLCGYLFDVASALSSFYHDCPVLKAETPATRDSRLRLVQLTSRVLARGLNLLGIEAPDRM